MEMEAFRRNFEKLDEVFINMTPHFKPLWYTDEMIEWLRGYIKDLSALHSNGLRNFVDGIKSNLKELNFKSEAVKQMKEIQSEVEREMLPVWEIASRHELRNEESRKVMRFIEKYVDDVFQIGRGIHAEGGGLKGGLVKEMKVNVLGKSRKRIGRVIKIVKEKEELKDPVNDLKAKLKLSVKEVKLDTVKLAKIVSVVCNHWILASGGSELRKAGGAQDPDIRLPGVHPFREGQGQSRVDVHALYLAEPGPPGGAGHMGRSYHHRRFQDLYDQGFPDYP